MEILYHSGMATYQLIQDVLSFVELVLLQGSMYRMDTAGAHAELV